VSGCDSLLAAVPGLFKVEFSPPGTLKGTLLYLKSEEQICTLPV